MNEREHMVASFLSASGWSDARRSALAGDASSRRYLRLTRLSGETSLLMEAPREMNESVRSFLTIARHLGALGMSAPTILAEDRAQGLVLLEDFGDALFARLLDRSPEEEVTLYGAAAEALAVVQRTAPPSGLIRFDPRHMADLIRIVFDWYRPAITCGARSETDDFVILVEQILAELVPDPTVLALRDFHAENLIWLPDRSGPACVGLLDFQDAVIAHPAYDLVSLLHDARRDIADETRAATTRRFLDLTGHDDECFAPAAAALSAQRNLRILGVFARLALRDGKPGYLRFMPRVWRLLLRDLAHPRLAALEGRVLRDLPAPDATALARLEARCATPAH